MSAGYAALFCVVAFITLGAVFVTRRESQARKDGLTEARADNAERKAVENAQVIDIQKRSSETINRRGYSDAVNKLQDGKF